MRKLRISRAENWRVLLLVTAVAAIFAVVMEWLFFVTQPSFISVFTRNEQLAMLLVGAAGLAALLCVPVLAGALLSRGRMTGPARVVYVICHLPATLILAAVFFLLLDNFTHTVFGYGIRYSDGAVRWLYLAVLVALAAAGFFLTRRGARKAARRRGWRVGLASLAGLVLAFGLLLRVFAVEPVYGHARAVQAQAGPRPNVLIIGSDGLNAEHLSLYGYRRDTTPFLTKLAQRSIVFENAYTNSAHTGGSVATILTGKLPTETKLIYPPDILQGKDAWQSLPALLKARGYRTVQQSLRHYADAYGLNFRGAFDAANGRSLESTRARLWLEWLAGNQAALLLARSAERLGERVLHILSIAPIMDPYTAVTQNERPRGRSDKERLRAFLQFIKPGAPPFFAHIHLMGTHGPKFHPRKRHYSEGQKQTQSFMVDFYDDAIREFDRLMRWLVGELRARGVYENTLIIVYSDHGMEYTTDVRIPLLVHLPGQDAGRRVHRNVAILDIGATVLDVLGLKQPGWMQGASLLARPDSPDNCDPIYSTTANQSIIVNTGEFFQTTPEPPLFSLGKVSLVVCDVYYEWDLIRQRQTKSAIQGSTANCRCEPLSKQQVRGRIKRHLKIHGYQLDKIDLSAGNTTPAFDS